MLTVTVSSVHPLNLKIIFIFFPNYRENFILTHKKYRVKLCKARNSKSESPQRGPPLKNSNDKKANDQNKNYRRRQINLCLALFRHYPVFLTH